MWAGFTISHLLTTTFFVVDLNTAYLKPLYTPCRRAFFILWFFTNVLGFYSPCKLSKSNFSMNKNEIGVNK